MIQRRQRCKTIVKRAEFGWGLFAAERIRSEEFIVEYVGEVYHSGVNGTDEARGIISNYLGRNYRFEISDYVELDATYAGNESRMINDYRPQQSRLNSQVKCKI